jgi:hypothetical protein
VAWRVADHHSGSQESNVSAYAIEVVLGGEVAVPCHPQSATAGLNPS